MGIADLADYNLGSHTQDTAAVSLCRDILGCMTHKKSSEIDYPIATAYKSSSSYN